MWPVRLRPFFSLGRRSPILRIGLVAGCVAVADRVQQAGHRRTVPTAPSPPPAAGLDHRLHARSAQATRTASVRAPSACRLTDCPNGMGYVPVTVRAAQEPGVYGQPPESGHPDGGHRPRFPDPRRQQYDHSIAGNFIEQEMPFVQPTATVVTIFAGINEVNIDHRGARRRRRRERSERATSTRRSARSATDYTTLLDRHPGARRLAAHRRAQRAERGRAAVSRRRAAGAAAGGAARRGRHDEDRRQSARVAERRRRRSDVRRAQLSGVELLVATACTRTMPATRSSPPKSSGRSRRVLSRAAEQLLRDDDRPVTFADVVTRLERGLRTRASGPRRRRTRLAPVPRREWPAGFNPARIRNAAGLLLVVPAARMTAGCKPQQDQHAAGSAASFRVGRARTSC